MKLTRKERRQIERATQKQVLEAYMFLHQFMPAEMMASTICSAPDHHPDVFTAIEAIEPHLALSVREGCRENGVDPAIGEQIINSHRLALRVVFEANKEMKNGVGLN
jgi:hypothetical protein